MSSCKFYLDTNALNYLAGLKGSDLQIFKKQIVASNSELSITHVQVDEAHEKELQNYQQKIQKALASLSSKGINVCLEDTKIIVFDVSRFGFARFGDENIGKLYDDLRKEIEACEKAKGKAKTPLNIACDAVIAVSSLNHDFFITTDRCLYDSWLKVIKKNKTLKQQFKVPKIIYARRSPKDVAKRIIASIATLTKTDSLGTY